MPAVERTLIAEDLPRPIVTLARDLNAGDEIPPHAHRRAQLVYAASGVMGVTTIQGVWVIPPERAVWVPGGVVHRIEAKGPVRMRTLYVEAAPGLPTRCCVVTVTPLLRELILRAVDIPALYDVDGADGRLVSVIQDELVELPTAPFHLPMPPDPRLRRLTESLARDPGNRDTLSRWASRVGASGRTLARLFSRETGMTFGRWRQQLRLLKALELLAMRQPVTGVAFELGYESPSAFIAMFKRAFGVSPARYFADGGARRHIADPGRRRRPPPGASARGRGGPTASA